MTIGGDLLCASLSAGNTSGLWAGLSHLQPSSWEIAHYTDIFLAFIQLTEELYSVSVV